MATKRCFGERVDTQQMQGARGLVGRRNIRHIRDIGFHHRGEAPLGMRAPQRHVNRLWHPAGPADDLVSRTSHHRVIGDLERPTGAADRDVDGHDHRNPESNASQREAETAMGRRARGASSPSTMTD